MRLFILILPVLSHYCKSEETVVDTDCGSIRGTVTPRVTGSVYEFLQIPYAEPPVESLRWTHSKPLENCPQEYDATVATRAADPIKCVHAYDAKYYPDTVRGVEDCLVLSVRSPDLNGSLPVLVWIHGGSLKTGHADYPGYSPDADFTDELQVVTVNINYRLDVFGFLSLPELWEDEENPGNYGNFGIGDAITALQWVQRNIAKFGGNPASVTVLGESSGGTIVLGLLGADKADGLFHKAISLSAPPLWEAVPMSAFRKRASFIKDVRCRRQTLEKSRKCLKEKPVLDVIKAQDQNRGWGFYDFPYADGLKGESMDYNVIEKTIVQTRPSSLMNSSRKQKVKIIIGNTAQETGTNAIDYNTNKISTWIEAKTLLTDRIENLKNEVEDFEMSGYEFEKLLEVYNYEVDSDDWWPQIFYDTLTTDIRTTCVNNDLVRDLNLNPNIEAYRLYVKSRPDEVKCGTRWSAIHGWDTEALFGYGYYGPGMKSSTINDIKQQEFKTNMRQLVATFCYDRASSSWNTRTSLIMENDNFPRAITLTDYSDVPQRRQCDVWDEIGTSRFAWQN